MVATRETFPCLKIHLNAFVTGAPPRPHRRSLEPSPDLLAGIGGHLLAKSGGQKGIGGMKKEATEGEHWRIGPKKGGWVMSFLNFGCAMYRWLITCLDRDGNSNEIH